MDHFKIWMTFNVLYQANLQYVMFSLPLTVQCKHQALRDGQPSGP